MTTTHDIDERAATVSSFSVELVAADADEETAVLSVHGEIDLATAPRLHQSLQPALKRGAGPVVVDLSEVPFMDSTGVHFLVDALRKLTAQHRRLAIACRKDGQVHRLLALVGVLDAVPVHASRASAVAAGDDRI